MLRISSLLLIILTLLIFSVPSRAETGRTIIAVQSARAKPFDETFYGFKTALSPETVIRRMILSELPSGDVAGEIRAASPDLVLAIGLDALTLVKPLTNIPVVYAMVLEADSEVSGHRQFTGVTMGIDPEKQLTILLEALPQTETIGLLFDPEQTGKMVDQIRLAAEKKKIVLIDRPIFRAKNVPLSIMQMRGKIDVFWMLPDLTVVTPETVEFLVLSAMQSKISILAFSEIYVEQGALLSVGVDPFDMGRQAAGMVEKILGGADAGSIPVQRARKAVLTINLKIARKLGITFDKSILDRARIVE